MKDVLDDEYINVQCQDPEQFRGCSGLLVGYVLGLVILLLLGYVIGSVGDYLIQVAVGYLMG